MASLADIAAEWPPEIPRRLKRLAERVCTPAEIQALKLYSDGWSYQRISMFLGISQPAVRSRIDRGTSKIRAHTDLAALPDHTLLPIRNPSPAQSRAKRFGVTIEPYDRGAIIRRDGGRCHLCGNKPDPANLVLDHLIPLSRGGPDSQTNVAVACRECNSARSNRDLPATSRYHDTPPPMLSDPCC